MTKQPCNSYGLFAHFVRYLPRRTCYMEQLYQRQNATQHPVYHGRSNEGGPHGLRWKSSGQDPQLGLARVSGR